MQRFHRLTLLGLSLALSACTLGPDFRSPDAHLPDAWALQQSPVRSQPEAASVQARWWDSFADAQLSALLQRAVAGNVDLQLAASRVQQSRAVRLSSGAAQVPSLDGQAGYSRARNSEVGLNDPSGNAGKNDYSLWQAGLGASWELDLWGRVRRQVEAADAQLAGSQALRDGVALSVLAETASDYIQLRGAQQLRLITEQNLQIAQRSLTLNQTRLDDGVATHLEVAEAASRVAFLEARLEPLRLRERRLGNALALLLGQAPGSLQAELGEPAEIPRGPLRVPVGLPSELASRRPDIRQAEAQLHAATASIGVAEADFYPRITLSGDLGLQALQLSDLDGWSAHRFAIGPAISVPLFDGGRRRGTLQLREAQQQEAAIAYQRTVLGAWHEVDDAMAAYQAQQRRHERLQEAVEQSRVALANAELQYQQGTVDYLNVLSVQQALLSNEEELLDSRQATSLALVGLYRALGGGWEQYAGGA